ncbi:hypothetical protein BN970_01377 [Mycolicibacterium conceptionense]|uniref:Uncharacterized protein n=1 Tax=Mycolicibacterium conceptionense TaxID=451644 RepID=A0A0U1D395_9MYCO|nr:hypothetical protein [Mycolicibacterium conceptionense]CQD07307.1 hypothetical protein BN970_01377 [Mycolicibacterium conceptionense]
MQLKLEGPIDSEDRLPQLEYGRHSRDVGRTWWIGFVWHIWTGIGWQKAIATKEAS